MSYYRRQWIFWALMLLMAILHVDFWSWQRLNPWLWGWLPYEMWYRGLLTLVCTALFWVLSRYLWPDPDPALLETDDQEGRPDIGD